MPTFVLLSWPIITLVIFAKIGPARGLIWSVAIGYLFLPEGFALDVPGLPSYDKSSAIALSGLLAALMFRRHADFAKMAPADPLARKVLLVVFAGLLLVPIGTLLTNGETLVNGPVVRQALAPWDVVSEIVKLLFWMTPLLLAWRLLRTPAHHRELLVAMVVLGLGYTLLVLFELRMSPQLNNWIYGYFPHSWKQHLRSGGYRPLVFLRHGLWLGFFLLTVMVAAIALSREKKKYSAFMPFAALWTFGILFISKNLGATALAVLLLPVAFMSGRMQGRIAGIIAVIFLLYPAIYQMSQGVLDKLLDLVGTVSIERMASLRTRLDNEVQLLARAAEKPLFGWGGWARMRILNENGIDISLIDGAWVIALGKSGWVGYLCQFGVLTLPILFLRRAARRKKITPAIGGMLVMAAGNLIYMIPNSTLSPIGLMVFGALAAFVQYDTAASGETIVASAQKSREVRYSRFADGQTPNPVRHQA